MILSLGKVSVIDSTALVALDGTIGSLVRRRHAVVLAGPLPRPRRLFDKAELARKHAVLLIAESLDAAIVLAGEVATGERMSATSSWPPRPTCPRNGSSKSETRPEAL